MSPRAALTAALLVVVALLAFAAVLLNVPLGATILGAVIASVGVVWIVGRVRRAKKKEPSIPT